jgi:protoporphyrinogen/coproporphyrinogen III oxidase
MNVVVIGAGVSGLTAAYRAQQRGVKVTLLEASVRAGGVIRTVRHDGCLLEAGPDCWVSTKPAGIELVKELGLESELTGTREGLRRSFILHKGTLKRMPEGFFLLAPTSIGALLRTRTLSLPGKLRMGLEFFKPVRQDDSDESLADFVRRRFGREALERIAQPMIAGIYTADPEKLSLQATFPQLITMEREHRSVIRALRKRGDKQQKAASGPRYGLFVSLRSGMQTLTDKLAERLDDLRLDTPVSAVRKVDGGFEVQTPGETLRADAVIMALPACTAGELLTDVHAELGSTLAAVPYASSAVINFVFERGQIGHALDGMGAVIPAVEGRRLIAMSFSSVKFEQRAPEGKVILRAFMGGALNPGIAELPAAEQQAIALEELRDLLGIRGEPLFADVCGHARRMAQYHVGHLERVQHIRQMEAEVPGLKLIGNGFEGIGIPDCIRHANDAVAALPIQ